MTGEKWIWWKKRFFFKDVANASKLVIKNAKLPTLKAGFRVTQCNNDVRRTVLPKICGRHNKFLSVFGAKSQTNGYSSEENLCDKTWDGRPYWLCRRRQCEFKWIDVERISWCARPEPKTFCKFEWNQLKVCQFEFLLIIVKDELRALQNFSPVTISSTEWRNQVQSPM